MAVSVLQVQQQQREQSSQRSRSSTQFLFFELKIYDGSTPETLQLHRRFSREERGRTCDICAEKPVFINKRSRKEDEHLLTVVMETIIFFFCSFPSDLFFLPGSIISEISSAAFRAHVGVVSSPQSCSDCGCVPAWMRGRLLSAKTLQQK